MSDQDTLCVVAVTTMNGEPTARTVKLCKDEDQAHRELERMAMAAIPSDGTRVHVRRNTEPWIEVKTHTKDGKVGPTYYFNIEKVGRSTA